MAEERNERLQIERLEGQISVYQTYVVNTMKLNLPDEQINKLAYFHEHATLPPVSSYKQVGVQEGDEDILRLIKDNRDRH